MRIIHQSEKKCVIFTQIWGFLGGFWIAIPNEFAQSFSPASLYADQLPNPNH